MWRVIRRAGIAAVLAGVAIAPAAAQERNTTPYVKIEGGYTFDWDSKFENKAILTDLELNEGIVAGGAIGFYLMPNLRTEAEAQYHTSSVDRALGPAVRAEGDIRTVTAMTNLLYDIPLTTRLRTFVGAGIGAALINKDYNIKPNPVTTLRDEDSDFEFAWQAMAGVSYDLTERLVFETKYRFLKTTDYEFQQAEARYQNHSVLAGLRFHLGSVRQPAPPPPPPPPPVVQPAPPPPPPAPSGPEELLELVFFGLDSAQITADAGLVLDQVAATIRDENIQAIRLEGHADRSGAVDYNLRLSQRRAESVRNGLIARGVPAGNVVISAKGEGDPRVPTEDGVREQSNRFVQIFVRYQDRDAVAPPAPPAQPSNEPIGL